MSESIYPCGLESEGGYGDARWWVGHADAVGHGASDHDKFVNAHRHEVVLWGEVTDDDASYSYDDWALIEIGDRFFLLNTSGCSCPSPSETWSVACEPGNLASQWAHLQSGNYHGWSVPGRQMSDFCKMFQFVAETKGWPDPTLPSVQEGATSGGEK